MREFGSFGAFSGFLEKLAVMVEADRLALDKSTALIQKHAKAKIGEYQEAAGPFASWAPLAVSTVAEKQALGYAPPDNPLLRTGEMRASIQRNFNAIEGHVGSDDPVMEWQELGTRHIPPRSALGAAAIEKGDEVAAICGSTIALVMYGSEEAFGKPLTLIGERE